MPGGRLIYGAADGRRRAERLLTPLYLLSNLVFSVVTAPSHWTLRPRVHPGPAEWAALQDGGRPLLYYSWHCYSWCSFVALRALPRLLRPTLLAHDGPISLLNSRSGTWRGFDMLVFVRRSALSPREQVLRYLREHRRPLMTFPDSGGPYFELKPGFFEVGRELDALLIPFVLRSRPRLVLGRKLRHLVPLPFARLELCCGEPLEAVSTDLETAANALTALDEDPSRALH